MGSVIPLTKKPEDSGYEIGCARFGQITLAMDKDNAGSGDRKRKCRQDPSGGPARVVKRWGGGGSPSSFAVTSNGNLFPILRKNEVHYESQFKSERVYFTREKKAESPNTLYHALALRRVRINKLF